MSMDIIRALAIRIKKHCKENETKSISLVFHGGEPLLVGKDYFRKIIEIFNFSLEEIIVNYAVQTNGTLIDDEWCQLFKEFNIHIGVSLDGPEKLQNKYRVYHNNKGSFSEVFHR
jgi:uncharacterized protein